MRILHACVFTVLALACGLQADAARRMDVSTGKAAANTTTGRLELVWGDPGEAAKASEGPGARFQVTLVDDAGRRHALDPDQALRAADDLYALYGRRIAVSTTTTAAKTGGRALRVIDAIVPIDDIAPASFTSRTRAGFGTRAPVQGGEKITGVTSWVTLMCKFSDIATEQKTLSFFQSQYGTAIGQLDHYWQEVSYGQINLAGSMAYGWADLPQPRSVYVTKDAAGKDKADLGKLFTDCVAAHDANVNFAVNGGVQGVNMMFNGDLDGYAWGGGRCATLDGVNKCWSTTWNPPWSFGNLAPLSHEMGHAYGLPHANNSDADSDPYDNPWDVMSDAWNNAVGNATYGSLPKHINVYSRNRLGWVATARKRTIGAGAGAASVTMDRISLPGSANTQMLILNYPEQSTRYYTVEVRKRTGNYENRLAGDAVIIHEVLTSRGEPAWSMDADKPAANRANNEGSMFKVGETWISPDYAFRVKVESATTEGFVVTVRPTPRLSRPGQSVQASASPKPASAATPASELGAPSDGSARDTGRLGERR
jgi:M6 family metalloprotease-like protein